MAMTFGVGFFQISHDELWPLFRWLSQLSDNAIDALFEREAGLCIIIIIGVGMLSENGNVGTGPVENSSAKSLSFGCDPDGFATVILWVELLFGIAKREHFARSYVEK